MTTRKKSVILKDFNPVRWSPKKGIDIAWKQIDAKNNEWYATLYGSDIAQPINEQIRMEDINNQLEKMSKNILSDRVRTLNNIPQYHTVCDVKEWIK